MNSSRFAVVLIGLLFALLPQPVAQAANDNITIGVTMMAMPKEKALAFIAKSDPQNKAGDALKELIALAGQKEVESVANPSLAMKSGQRSMSESGSTKLDAEAVASPNGDLVDITLIFSYEKTKITTSVNIPNGGVKYLGSFDDPDGKNILYLAFIRADIGK